MRYHVVVALSCGQGVDFRSKVAEEGNLGRACARACVLQRLNPSVFFYVEDTRYKGADISQRIIFTAAHNL